MPLKEIDHVGILVRDLDKTLRKHERLFGAKATDIDLLRKSGLRVAFMPVGEGSLEFLEPLAKLRLKSMKIERHVFHQSQSTMREFFPCR